MQSHVLLILLLPALLGQAPAADGLKADPAAKARREHFREIYLADAASYSIYLDAGREEKAELRREPAYSWTNPTRNTGQDGDVFVWTYRGAPRPSGRSSPRRPRSPAAISSMRSIRCRSRSWKSIGPAVRGGSRSSPASNSSQSPTRRPRPGRPLSGWSRCGP